MNQTLNQYPEIAVALKYDGVGAPRITAKGSGELAQQILEAAAAHQVPLEQDAELAGLLAQIPLGDEVPQELYVVIAQIIAFAYRLSGRVPPGWEPPKG